MNNDKRGEVSGWKLVPVKPTEQMHVAAVRTLNRCTGNDDFPRRVYAAMLNAAPVDLTYVQAEQEPFAWACWADGLPMVKHTASLCGYEPLAYPQRIKLYANALAIVHAALDAAIEIAKTSGDSECITGMIELRRNPQEILDGMTK